jgi:hypothetical protein
MKLLCGVIIFDIVGSRKLEQRRKVQDLLSDYINQVNNKFSNILVAPINITLGDEWEVVTSDPTQCYKFVQEFQQLFWEAGIELYAGIGIGPISTSMYSDIRKMDGPAFHRAREAMNIVKMNDTKRKFIHSKKNRVYFYDDKEYILEDEMTPYIAEVAATSEDLSNNEDISNTNKKQGLNVQDLINVLIENNEILKSKITSKQKKTYIDYQKHGSYRNMIQAYEEKGETTSIGNISEKLNTAEYFAIQNNELMIKNLFKYYCYMRGV